MCVCMCVGEKNRRKFLSQLKIERGEEVAQRKKNNNRKECVSARTNFSLTRLYLNGRAASSSRIFGPSTIKPGDKLRSDDFGVGGLGI